VLFVMSVTVPARRSPSRQGRATGERFSPNHALCDLGGDSYADQLTTVK
jgi:hypothetical protein